MSEIECIVDLLQSGYNGTPWHGPSLVANLNDLTAAQAVQKPIPNGHCIWELVQHVTAWVNVTINTIDGQQYTILPVEQDWPAISGTDDAAWQGALDILDSSMGALIAAVGELQDDSLWDNLPGMEFNMYWLLMGVVQHSAYHAGQIGLLKKGLV
jgi:DinB superfamily